MYRKICVAAGIGLLPLLSAGALAESVNDTIETVTVTARKLPEDLQKVPASITVLTAADLRAAGATTTADLFSQAPNIAMSGGIAGALQGQVSIRGVSSLVRNIGVEAGTGFYVDGVYQGRPENYNQDLIDVAQVEVLRGPQGTLFGKNTIAGAFNITTVRPDADQTHALLNVELGNYGLAHVQGYVTGPLVDDTLSAKLSLGYVTQNGFYRHLHNGQSGDSLNQFSYRGSLYYTPTSNSEFILTVDGLRDRGRPAFFQVTDLAGFAAPETAAPHTLANNRPNYLHRDNYGVSLTGNVTMPFGTLTSITAYRQSAYQASLDDDQNQVDYIAQDKWGDRSFFWSQELRLNGTLGDTVDYVAGLYYLGQTVSTVRSLGIGSDLGVPPGALLGTDGRVESNAYAAYGNVNWHITDALTASVGLRYSYEDKQVAFSQLDPTGIYTFFGLPNLSYAANASDGDLSPTASLSWQASENAMLYARIARGYKSAAFNVDLVSTTQGLSARPENATSYEIGLKSDWLDRRIRLDGAAFLTHYNDMQVSEVLGTAPILSNAARATIKGAELELTAIITQELRLRAGIGAVDARYDSFAQCQQPLSAGGLVVDCAGNQLIGAPSWTGNVAAEYVRSLGWAGFVARLDYAFQSPVYFEASNSKRFESDSQGRINIRAGLDFGAYSVMLWAKNLGNDTYITYADDRSTIGIPRTTAYGPPRTFGATLSAQF
ncbi:MAG TPA: TonB-dependent receptor [Rhizomicrobium sp.]|nr:TonB-dependent receptor [Rhizomicrobium sp.]